AIRSIAPVHARILWFCRGPACAFSFMSTEAPAAAPPAQREHANTGLRQVTPGVRGVGLLRSFDWKHAVAELLLIAVGVLAALAVNNWNDERRQRRLESTMLGQLRVELSSDLAVLRQIDDEIRERERRMVALLADLDRGGPEADSG